MGIGERLTSTKPRNIVCAADRTAFNHYRFTEAQREAANHNYAVIAHKSLSTLRSAVLCSRLLHHR